jgi:segregation and condensation protein B
MDETEIKHVVEAALLAAGRPLTLDRLTNLFTARGSGPDRDTLRRTLDTLAVDYQGRGIELREVAGGWRVQVRRTMSDWLAPLWEERAPRYTRALLETLALIAYRQPITRAEIEEVRGVVVSTNIVRTLLERNWVRVVGHRDVPGKPAMFGTTREFLDYFGLKKLEDLPPLAELKDGIPELSPQTDLIESLEEAARFTDRTEEGEEERALAVVVDIRSQSSDNAAPAPIVAIPLSTSAAPDDDDDSDSPDFDDDEDYDVELDDENEDEDDEEEDEEDDDERDDDEIDDDDDDDDDDNETEDRMAAPLSEDQRPSILTAPQPLNSPTTVADEVEPNEQESADLIPLRARASGDGTD